MTVERPMFPPRADGRCQIIQFSTGARISPKRLHEISASASAIVASVHPCANRANIRPERAAACGTVDRNLQEPAPAGCPPRRLAPRQRSNGVLSGARGLAFRAFIRAKPWN
jgi:hypothetical protein